MSKPVIIQYKNDPYSFSSWEHWPEAGYFSSCEAALQFLLDRWAKNGRCKKFDIDDLGILRAITHTGVTVFIRFYETTTGKVLKESPWKIGLNEVMK